MKFTRKLSIAVSLLAVIVSAALAAPVQRIHEIQRPLMSVPAIVRAGDSFEALLNLDGGKRLASVSLISPTGEKTTLATGAMIEKDGTAVVIAAIPASAAEALYGFEAAFADGSTDTQPHAVKVVAGFKKDFTFIHLTDIHFNVGAGGTNVNHLRVKLLEKINELSPEFVLFSGDLGLYPETYDRDYLDGWNYIRDNLKVPIFMVPGNHELYYDERSGARVDGMDYWKATYGPLYHSFDYGALHVVGLNTFDWPDRWRNRFDEEVKNSGSTGMSVVGPEQWEWLQADMEKANATGKKTLMHTHIPIDLLQGGRMVGMTKPEKIKGPTLRKLTDFLNHYRVSHIFVGHVHVNSERKFGTTTEVLTLGAGNSENPKDAKWGFRIVNVSDGVITGMKIYSINGEGVEIAQ